MHLFRDLLPVLLTGLLVLAAAPAGRGQPAGHRAGQEVPGRPRGQGPAAGRRRRPGLVERQHHRQGRGLQEEGGGPEQDRRGPCPTRTRSPNSRRSSSSATRARSTTRSSPGPSTCSTCMYLEKQVDPALLKKITAKANAVEQTFNVFRAKVDGKEMTDSEVRKVLKKSSDSTERRRPSGRRARWSGPTSRRTSRSW